MFEVLIVDDEPLARQSLKFLIDWEEHGFRIRAEAEDGMQALELIQEQYFSLVLTDIRMPKLNGLELVRRMKEYRDLPVVILSGYDDFEYARQGLQLGVQDYLLKPVDEEELVPLLRRLAAEIAAKERGSRQWRHGLTAYRDAMLRRAAHGQINGAELEGEAALAEVDWEGKRLFMLLADAELDESLSERELELSRYAIRNVAEELFSREGYVFMESEQRFGVVLTADPQEGSGLPEAAARRLAGAMRAYAKVVVTVGVGSVVDGAGDLSRSFREAERALDGKFLHGEGRVLKLESPTEGSAGGRNWGRLEEEEERLLDAIRSHDDEGMREAIGALRALAAREDTPADLLRYELLGLLVRIYQLAKSSGIALDSWFDRREGDYVAVTKAKTIDALFGYLSDKCEEVLAALRRMRELKSNKVTAEVMDIVNRHYSEDISLRNVAKRVFLNPNYLGKMFKASTGQSFNEYLLQVRMEKAKELLLQTDLKIYEIARQVGYEELDWFYKKFKAYANVSAGEFRARSAP